MRSFLRLLRRLLGALALLAACGVGLPLPASTLAQFGAPGLWPTASRVSSAAFRSLEPDVAYDSDGFAHVAYFGGPTQDQWAIYYTNNRSGAFFPARLISEPSGEQRSPDIAVGGDGHVQVIYEKRASADIMYVESPDRGATWAAPLSLTPGDAKAYEAAIAIDAANTVHAVWCDRRWTGVQSVTYAARPAGGAWAAPGPLSAAATFDRYPDVTTIGGAADVRVHIVYQGRPRSSNNNVDFEIFYVASAGGRFQPARAISNDSGAWSLEPAISSAGTNQLAVVWDKQVAGSHDIVFARSLDLGQTWTEPRDIAQRPAQAVSPALAYSAGDGSPQVHIAWDEGGYALYLRYDPGGNSFGTAIEQVSTQRQATDVGVAASPSGGTVALSYQGYEGSTLQAYVAIRGATALVGATLAINDDAPFTTSRSVTITLSDLRGAPTEMRYAWAGSLESSAAWVPFQPSFSLTIPAPTQCEQNLSLQLRAADGGTSAVLHDSIVLDDAVQARAMMRNPFSRQNAGDYTEPPAAIQDLGINGGASDGDRAYTREDLFYLQVDDGGECSALAQIRLSAFPTLTYTPANNRFGNVVPLPALPADPANYRKEGPRAVGVELTDTRGNRAFYTQTLTLDTTPPQLLGGGVAVAGGGQRLLSTVVDLRISGLRVSDNLYPNELWGLWIANSLDASKPDDDPTLDWRPIAVAGVTNGDVLVRRWNVVFGLQAAIGDRALAGRPIQIRIRALDGAGNPSRETPLVTTVTLSPDYAPAGLYLPLVQVSRR